MHSIMRYIIGSICILMAVWMICCESFVNKAQNTNQNLKSVNEAQEQIQENDIPTNNKIKLDDTHYLIKEWGNVYISCTFISKNKSEEITVYVPVKQEDYNEFLSANISVADLIKKADTAISTERDK